MYDEKIFENSEVEYDKSEKALIQKISGTCYFHGAPFSYSVNRQKSGTFNYRGSVKALDMGGNALKKRGKAREIAINSEIERLKKKKIEPKDNNYYPFMNQSKLIIRKDVYCQSTVLSDIKQCIFDKINECYQSNKTVIISQISNDMRPDKITPFWAVQRVGKAYVLFAHPDAQENLQKTYLKRLHNITEIMPADKPMCLYKESAFSKFAKENMYKEDTLKEIFKFWDYCIKVGVCEGTNPVKVSTRKIDKDKKNQKSSLERKELEPAEVDRLYDKLEEMDPVVAVGIALMLSGFSVKVIEKLTWSDLEFKRELDFVIVKFKRDGATGATKCYDRPVIPRSAIMVRKYYKTLLERERSKVDDEATAVNNLESKRIMEKPNKRKDGVPFNYPSNYLIQDARRVLSEIGISYADIGMVRDLDADKTAAARTILYNTYTRMIMDICNVKTDKGTMNYLLGKSFNSDTTSDSYTDFSNRAGLRRLYNIMKILGPVKRNKVTEKTIPGENDIVKIYYPDKSNEYVLCHGYIGIVLPGASIEIEISHGGEGAIEGKNSKTDG